MTRFKDIKNEQFMRWYTMELEDFRGVKDEDDIEMYKNDFGEFCIAFYKPDELKPFYELTL